MVAEYAIKTPPTYLFATILFHKPFSV